MPPLLNQGEIICEARIKLTFITINDFFSSQNIIDETNARITEENFENRQNNTIESIHLYPLEVETCLTAVEQILWAVGLTSSYIIEVVVCLIPKEIVKFIHN